MPSILLLGKNGQVGWELRHSLRFLGEVTALGRKELDLANLPALRRAVRDTSPDIIVNAAAYTNVDGAESEPDLAHLINAEVPRVLAQEAARLEAVLVHYSTDYVFDGRKGVPYTEADTPFPINEYGKSKLAGEKAIQAVEGPHLILRLCWVYSTRRPCFVTKVWGWARQNRALRIVDDQWGSPTWCHTAAAATLHALKIIGEGEREARWRTTGVYHFGGRGVASRHEWARRILTLTSDLGSVNLSPASSREFPTPSLRPRFTALAPDKFESTFDWKAPSWDEDLERALLSGTS